MPTVSFPPRARKPQVEQGVSETSGTGQEQTLTGAAVISLLRILAKLAQTPAR
jgi:hypothetical protein